MSKEVLPENLKGADHRDYPKFLRWIPRSWTSFNWGVPVKMAGNQKRVRIDGKLQTEGPSPVGEWGSWQISKFPNAPWFAKYIPAYLAFTTKKGFHFRIGARWDDVDGYTTIPTIAVKRYNKP